MERLPCQIRDKSKVSQKKDISRWPDAAVKLYTVTEVLSDSDPQDYAFLGEVSTPVFFNPVPRGTLPSMF